jgi:tryptophan 7-halogenase
MDDTSGKSKHHLVIVGGGTAGWMAAALLSRQVSPKECRITVIAENDSGIGVGEATIPSINSLLRTLGADEAEFMQVCDATWKLAIQFSDWLKPEHDYWHPFGVAGAKIDERDLFPYWLRDQKRPYQTYSLNWAAAVAGKSPHSLTMQSPIAATGAYAFHLNAKKLSMWLQQRALNSGVQQIHGHVAHASRNDAGDVATVELADGNSVAADFFIDCSGFESVLLRQTLDDQWIDWSGHLLCDRAVAVRTPGKAIIPSHTRSLGLTAGWSWDIPLQSQRGLGYVYSGEFISDDDAWKELRAAHRLADDAELEPQFLQMRVGRQTQFWHHNVLAIGLSAGFIEPLESTGLHLAQVGLERFVELFAISGETQPLQQMYNREMAEVYDQARDFVQLHYHLSQREEAFWKASRELPLSVELQHRLRLYSENATVGLLRPEAFPESSYYFLLTGNGRLPKRPPAQSLAVEADRLQFVMQAIQDQNRTALRNLPLHEEMLRHIQAASLARAS